MIDLTAWIDLNGPYHDRCFSKRRNPSAVPALTPAVAAALKRRCAECHGEKDLARPDWVDIAAPQRSRFLVAPLAKAAAGAERCGQPVFASKDDAEYSALCAWAREQAGAANGSTARRRAVTPRQHCHGLPAASPHRAQTPEVT